MIQKRRRVWTVRFRARRMPPKWWHMLHRWMCGWKLIGIQSEFVNGRWIITFDWTDYSQLAELPDAESCFTLRMMAAWIWFRVFLGRKINSGRPVNAY